MKTNDILRAGNSTTTQCCCQFVLVASSSSKCVLFLWMTCSTKQVLHLEMRWEGVRMCCWQPEENCFGFCRWSIYGHLAVTEQPSKLWALCTLHAAKAFNHMELVYFVYLNIMAIGLKLFSGQGVMYTKPLASIISNNFISPFFRDEVNSGTKQCTGFGNWSLSL